MPNPAARAAHAKAQTIYAQMGAIQSQEACIIEAMHASFDGPDMKGELLRLSKNWHALWAKYRVVMAEYTEALMSEHAG